jgi:deoxyribonuclease IV
MNEFIGQNPSVQLGLKLYTTDTPLIPAAANLKKKALIHYIELYVVPQTTSDQIEQWRRMDASFVIHAAHAAHGVNLAQAAKEKENRRYFARVKGVADTLRVDRIIVHGGNNGSIEETIRQVGMLGDERIVIENKPKIGILDEACVGWSPAEFQQIADAGLLNGMALDFAHASCAARSEGMSEREMISQFLAFRPKLYHVSDGISSSQKDVHLNLGEGDRDLAFYLSCVSPGGLVTIETPRTPSKGLDEFVDDVNFLFGLLQD